jgi:hypothetical protein
MATIYPRLQREHNPVPRRALVGHKETIEYNGYFVVVDCYCAILWNFKDVPFEDWVTRKGWYYEVRNLKSELIFSSLHFDLTDYTKAEAIEAGKKEIDRL